MRPAYQIKFIEAIKWRQVIGRRASSARQREKQATKQDITIATQLGHSPARPGAGYSSADAMVIAGRRPGIEISRSPASMAANFSISRAASRTGCAIPVISIRHAPAKPRPSSRHARRSYRPLMLLPPRREVKQLYKLPAECRHRVDDGTISTAAKPVRHRRAVSSRKKAEIGERINKIGYQSPPARSGNNDAYLSPARHSW